MNCSKVSNEEVRERNPFVQGKVAGYVVVYVRIEINSYGVN